MTELAALCLITACAGFVQGLSGFGSVLLSLPLLSFFLPIKTVIPLVALLAFCINLWLTIQLRKNLRLDRLMPLLVATLPGIPMGVYGLKNVPAHWLAILVGVVINLFAVYSLLFPLRPRSLGTAWALPAGFLAGCLGGSIGANGPPIILYASLQPWPKDEIKALLSHYFLAAGVCISATHAVTGLITGQVLKLFAMGLPTLALGILAGTAAYRHMGDGNYRRLVYMALLVFGSMMLLHNC